LDEWFPLLSIHRVNYLWRMAFFRHWPLIVLFLLLGGGHALAASREERLYSAAVQAFHDKFYPLATNRLAQYLESYGNSTNAPAAMLLLAQAEYYLKDYASVTNRLADPANLNRAQAAGLAERYEYCRAEALFALGDAAEAARIFAALAESHPKSPLALNAVVEAAAAFQSLGQWRQSDALLDDTAGLFQQCAQAEPANEEVVNGRLLQAASKCAQRDFTGAMGVLNMLPAALAPEQNWKRAYFAYNAALGLNEPQLALAASTNMILVARLELARPDHTDNWATNLAESVSCQAEALTKLDLLPEAAAAWHTNLLSDVPANWAQEAISKLADLAILQTNLLDAETEMTNFLAQFPQSPAVETARLKLGELDLRDYLAQPSTNQIPAAMDQFQAVSTNGPLAGKAFLDLGWCHWLNAEGPQATNRDYRAFEFAQSLSDFSRAAEKLPVPSEDWTVAKFKMGDAEFALAHFAEDMGDLDFANTHFTYALTNYDVLTDLAGPLAPRAVYQSLRAHIALHDSKADSDMNALLDINSGFADTGLLLAGEAFSGFNLPTNARAVFLQFESVRTNSPYLPRVAFALARTYEQERDWTGAVTHYDAWLGAYPTNELRPQVEYARDWSVYESGDEDGAFQLFTNFVSQYPTNALAATARWWVADHYFRQGTNFVQAELNYEHVFQDFPANELAYRAQLMAGRAALGRFGPDAQNYFLGVINDTNCPEDLRDQARFGYCEALRQMSVSDTTNASLQVATSVLAQMCPKAGTNITGALAWSEIGDLDFQMGAYDSATNAYACAMNAAAASAEVRFRAQIGLGIALEKKADAAPDQAKGLLDLAMQNYAAVFDPETPSDNGYWRKQAAMHILALNARTGTKKGKDLDDFLNRLQQLFPQLKDSPELKRFAAKE
jgi:TolA-binding protein